MRPRMYGSSESHRFLTSTSPSRSGGTALFSRRKFSSLTHPSGRLASTTRWLSMAASLTGATALAEHARGTQHAQHFGPTLELGIERNQQGVAFLACQLFLQNAGGARIGETPGEAGAAFLESRAVVEADEPERAAQHLELRRALEVAPLGATLGIEVLAAQRIAAREIAPADELERTVDAMPAAEIVELGGADALTHEIAAVGPQSKRHAQAAGAARRVHVGGGQRGQL